ncbi:hypothetical protein ACFR97_17640 [Haloplanus litoreus]|uniref:Small CPxCG-related zinc finger protein n=1 Tax=Haloplanus litoreus TaxID=767515 RepID=A0ABD6A441_9EURY
MPTCECCGGDVDETFTLALEWPAEDPDDYDDPSEFEDPGAAVFDVCGRCADGVASNVLVDRAVTRGFDDVYAGLYAPPEVRP